MDKMKHFLIIPFNAGNKDSNWLEHRMQFFNCFTSPSITSQTNQNFTAVFLIDPTLQDDIRFQLMDLGLVYETESFWAIDRGDIVEQTDEAFSNFLKSHVSFSCLSIF